MKEVKTNSEFYFWIVITVSFHNNTPSKNWLIKSIFYTG
jgi:hypothetical protein